MSETMTKIKSLKRTLADRKKNRKAAHLDCPASLKTDPGHLEYMAFLDSDIEELRAELATWTRGATRGIFEEDRDE